MLHPTWAAVTRIPAESEGEKRLLLPRKCLSAPHSPWSDGRWKLPLGRGTIVICFDLQKLLQICACHLWDVADLVPSDPTHMWGLFRVYFSSCLSASRSHIFPSHKLLREQKQKRSWCTRSCSGVPWMTSPAEVRDTTTVVGGMMHLVLDLRRAGCQGAGQEPGINKCCITCFGCLHRKGLEVGNYWSEHRSPVAGLGVF